MPVVARITLDPSQYIRAIDEVKDQTIKTTDSMSKGAAKFGRDMGQAGKAVSMVSSEIGASLGDAGKAFSLLSAGPVAALTASIGLVAAAGAQMWDMLTVSADEYYMKLTKEASIEEKHLASLKKAQGEENEYMERLKELSTRESLSNSEKEEAVFLLDTLTDRYKGFSATIDETTGRIIGLTEAEIKLKEAQKERKQGQLEEVIQNLNAQSDASVRGFVMPSNPIMRAKGWFTGELRDAKEFASTYSSMSAEGRMDFARESLADATTKDAIQFWSEEIDRLQKIIDLTAELDTLKKLGTETQKEYAAELEAVSEAERKQIEAETQAYERFNAARIKAEEDRQKQADAAARAELERMQREEERLKREENARNNAKQKIRSEVLRATGRGTQATIEEALLSAEQAKGSPLTDEERQNTIALTSARVELNQLTKASTAPMDYAPRVNSLIARGGSAQAVKLPSLEDLQKRTLSTQESIDRTAKEILRYVNGFGKVTNV